MLEVNVRAIPAPGFDYRRRAGRAWTKEVQTVKVVDAPKAADEISPAQYAELQRDPMINAVPVGGADPQVLGLKGELAEKDALIEKLRGELSAAIEMAEEMGTRSNRDAEVAGMRIRELEAEVERLRAGLGGKKGSK
jgi:hypothetical protein